MSDTPSVGEIRLFASEQLPKGWLPCKGNLLSISQNTALYSLLGTQFGGDGRVSFGLPNLPDVPGGNGGTLIYGLSLSGMYVIPDSPTDGMTGMIQPWPTLRLPLNWVPCDGRTLLVELNRDLFELIGTRFGGDGTNTFALPTLPPLLSGGTEIPYCICTSGFFPAQNGSVYLDFISRVFAFPATYTPAGTVRTDGQSLAIRNNQVVFALLGTRFGGNGNTTFAVPTVAPLKSGGSVDVPYSMFTQGLFPVFN
jgi:microcystin-dependent protein